jgi:SAM-dependent methyltransferase
LVEMMPNFLESIRLDELRAITDLLSKTVKDRAKVLELGAGTGWQARELSAAGYDVVGIDIPSSNHRQSRVWDIVEFDGVHVPFPDESFDVVYSSNVLEHVCDKEALNQEVLRVLKPNGIAIHYVPTASWRLWSLVAFYPAVLKECWSRLMSTMAKPSETGGVTVESTSSKSLIRKIWYRVVPHAHGAVGSALGELLRFRRRNWDSHFLASGWQIAYYGQNGLCLSGDMLFGRHLSLRARRRLGKVLGSTAHLYVLRRL